MAVLGRLLISSAERLDLPDLLSIDSYSAGDWKYFMETLVGEDTPYIIKGFEVISPAQAIGTQSCSIEIADSAMYYPGSGAGSFYYGLPVGNADAQPLVPALIKNATNYVYLTMTTLNTAEDTRAFWDPDANGGTGDEFTEQVNTETAIQVQASVSTGAFPANTVPIAIIVVGPSVITSIEDARPLMFRLGTGGIDPNPANRFAWPALPSASYEQTEPPITITSSSGVNPFQGGDKNITSLKEWMDAVMSQIADLGGTQYWYEDASTFNLVSIFNQLNLTFYSKGKYQHSSATPGQLTITENLVVKSVNSPQDVTIQAGTIQIPDEYVAYIDLVTNQPINSGNEAVSFVNGQAYANTPNGSIGYFANLSVGDWISVAGDPGSYILQVEGFWSSTNGGGTTTTAANAKSITLSGPYQGNSGTNVATYNQGTYTTSEIQIQARSNPAISAAGGNFLWLVLRSDTILAIGSISSVTVTGTLTVVDGSETSPTGTAAQIVATAHGLNSGELITVTAPSAQAGTYTVDVVDANTFFINTTNATAGAFTGYYGLCTTAATATESANNGFDGGETIIIAGTTNYNGEVVVQPRTSTQFQFPLGGTFATETAGTATLARLDVRSEEGITKVVQGETIDIGEGDSDNIQKFIGMTSLAETHPNYFTGPYNTLSNLADYNTSANDSLTLRASKLTAMMADKAQDKTLKYLCNASSAINTASGSAQVLTFAPASSTLTILQPGSPGNAVVSLPPPGPGISLLVNQSAYVIINRNAASTPTITVANTASIPIDENVVVIASRLGDTTVWLWNGETVINSTPLQPTSGGLVKVKYFDPVSQTLPTGNPVTEDGFSVQAGDTVLFSNLSSGTNNAIYMANGTGTNITGWSIQFSFNGNSSPSSADTVIVEEGQSFQDQVGKFNDTTWVFNDKVRYFNITSGAGAEVNYFEQDAIAISTLNDATTNGTVTSYTYLNSEYAIIDFSIHRSTARETGTIYVTTDGVNVQVAVGESYIGNSGVTFSGTITGGTFNLLYTTTATGSSGTMKFMVRRWSDANGGPAGVPSYSGGSGGAGTPGGPVNSIQYSGGSVFDGSSNFLIDTAGSYIGITGAIELNGLNQSILSAGLTLVDNTSSPAALFSYPKATFPFAVIEYSVVRDGIYRTGRFMIANDGTITSESDDFVETATTGVTLTAAIVGSNVVVMYTTTSTGFNGTFKYSGRSWS
jgi:hypothetical protein